MSSMMLLSYLHPSHFLSPIPQYNRLQHLKSLVTKRDKRQGEKIELPPRKDRRYTGKYNPTSICLQNEIYYILRT